MKDWHFKLPTAVGGFLALVVLWTQFGDRIGLPSWHASGIHSEEQRRDEFRWNRELAAGETVEIKGINGSVNAERATGDRVEVVAVKTGKRSDPRLVKIEVVEHGKGITLCAVYPGSRGGSDPCSSGGRNTQNNDVQVRFDVRLPAGVGLVANTVNGSIKATDLESDMVANTVNGSISLSTAGRAEASTVNGSIKAEIGANTLTDDLKFSTVNGSITVQIPDDFNARVGASTVGGSLSTDFPLTVSRRRMQGVLGSGGPELSLSAVNGTVRLKRAQ